MNRSQRVTGTSHSATVTQAVLPKVAEAGQGAWSLGKGAPQTESSGWEAFLHQRLVDPLLWPLGKSSLPPAE